MKRLLAIIFLAIVLFCAWWLWHFFQKDTHQSAPPQEAIKIGKHSSQFNQSVLNVVSSYLLMKNAFVNADTVTIKLQGQKLMATIDTLKLDELKKDDSAILITAQQYVSDTKANAGAMIQELALVEMREDFRMVSENLYSFLKTIGYEGQKLYWQNCPMAFGENKEGTIDVNWISNTPGIINPYFSKNHPGDKPEMNNCGETKDSLPHLHK